MTPVNPRIRVFLADDHELVRDGLRELIGRQPEFIVVGESGHGDDVAARAADGHWDLLLLDLSLPGLSTLDLVTKVRRLQPTLRIIILTMRPEDGYAVRLVRAGVKGYVTKGSSSRVLLEALRAVAAGGDFFSDELHALLLDSSQRGAQLPHETFSFRETEIFRLYVGGLSTNVIARKLGIDASTVSTHLKNIREKLGVADSRNILSYAAAHGLLSEARWEKP